MDKDIRKGKNVVHGIVAGAASSGYELTSKDRTLTPEQRLNQQLAIFGLQLLGHALTEIGAAAFQAARDADN
jgi:hypothetical protein